MFSSKYWLKYYVLDFPMYRFLTRSIYLYRNRFYKQNIKNCNIGSNYGINIFSLKHLVFSIIFLMLLLYCLYTKTNKLLLIQEKDMKFVLLWTYRFTSPFNFLEDGNKAFRRNKCKFKNCYTTNDKNFFDDITLFDAVMFNNVDMHRRKMLSLPEARSPKQKYIFGAMESALSHPVHDRRFDGFFNWTWTYRLDSDFRWGYMAIYDLEGNLIGPKINMEWRTDMKPIDDGLKTQLSNKTKAAAWFVSHCKTNSRREVFVTQLCRELSKYGLNVDIFGSCRAYACSQDKSYKRCSNRENSKCFQIVRDKYFFTLAFENDFAEDYVTEKLTNALNYNAVPIVYGGANYTRFVPIGSYLDARKLGPRKLAMTINTIVNNKTMYHDFFRWRNHYRYEQRDRNDVCKLCTMLNDEAKMAEVTVWRDFRRWWHKNSYYGH